MQHLKGLLLVALALVFYSSYSKADQTGNILNNTWSGCTARTDDNWGGTSGGSTPWCGPSQINWGYGGGIISKTVAINNALKEVGIQVEGFTYSWEIKNLDANETNANQANRQDPMEVTVSVYKANGELYRQYNYDYSRPMDWTTYSGTETFPDQFLDPSFFGNLKLSAEGDDTGYWAGYWGPELGSSPSINLVYSSNPCYGNPLYDPQCDGYAEAYATKILEEQAALLASIPEPTVQEEIYEEPTLSTQNTGISEGSTSTQEQVTISNAAELEDQSDDTREKVDPIGIALKAAGDDVSFVLNNIIGESNGLEINQTQSSLGLGNAQAQSQSSSSSNQNDSEERKTRGQKLKQAAKQRAAGLQEQIIGSEEMDEQQAAQAEMLAMMNYVPGFDSYKVALAGGTYPDVPFYPPSNVPDSQSGVRNNLAQQLLHQEMVDMQYRR
jgi:hypothetical protein